MIGKTFGDFIVKEEIGKGGMGKVYKAFQISLNRDVALKILHQDLSRDNEFTERFDIEAKSVAAMVHQNIIQMYSKGVSDEGIHYFAMEYVDGEDLSSRLKRGAKFSEKDVLDIAIQACQGLECAWKLNIIHRDIKPSNLIITDDDVVKIADFGLAKGLDATKHLTLTNVFMGTAHYTSPEQGAGKPVDHRTDIYSLGIVIYQLLTNKVPFDAESITSVIYKHAHEKPLPPRNINPSLSPQIEEIVLKAIAKAPSDRYQSVVELRQDLAKVKKMLDEKGVETATVALKPDLSAKKRYAIVVAGSFLIIAGLVLYLLMVGEPTPYQPEELVHEQPELPKEDDKIVKKQDEQKTPKKVVKSDEKQHEPPQKDDLIVKGQDEPELPLKDDLLVKGQDELESPLKDVNTDEKQTEPKLPGIEKLLQQPLNQIESRGFADMNDPTISPKVYAIEDSLRNAVITSTNMYIRPEAEKKYFEPINETIYSKHKDFCPHYEVLNEKEANMKFIVDSLVTVKTNEIKNNLSEIINSIIRKRNPRVMVIVDENVNTDDNHSLGTASVSETTLIDKFLENKFKVVDSETAKKSINRDQSLNAIFDDTRVAAEIGQQYEAEIVITGKATAKVSDGIMGTNLKPIHANLALKAIRTDTAEIIASSSEQMVKTHINETAGAHEAFKETGIKLADLLIEKILNKWASETELNTVELTLIGLESYSELSNVERLLKHMVSSIKGIIQRSFTGNVGKLEVTFTGGNTLSFAEILTMFKIGNTVLEITDLTQNKIQANVNKIKVDMHSNIVY